MFKSYNFWIRLVAVLVLLLRIVGAELGFNVDSGLIIDLATAIASVLVVLGVIQVPVEKSAVGVEAAGETKNNNIGGGVMKTFEQIKDDILTVKEKIASSLTGEESVLGEIAVILDGIIAGDEEKTEPEESVSVTIPEGEVYQMNEVGEIIVGEAETIVIECDEKLQGEKIVEVGEDATQTETAETGLTASEAETIEEQQSEDGASIDKTKFNEVVRRKMLEMFEKEFDSILEEVMV